MDSNKIRNIAIIAHVDHGKTTLVDQMFKQSGMFRDNQQIAERLMDSMDLEKERGITISSKNGAFDYNGYHINLVDTPGHADFSGQVERILKMVDGALLLVDAAEGPMPQTYYVLKKALQLSLPIIVVINKIDKPAARCEWAVDQVLELLIKLDAPEESLDFPVIYASAKEGFATNDHTKLTQDLKPLFDLIIKAIPAPVGEKNDTLQLLVSTLSYSPFLGRLAIGKISSGMMNVNQEVVIAYHDFVSPISRISKIYNFKGNQMVESPSAQAGEIVAVSGLDSIQIGETITSPSNPQPLPFLDLDPPTISMNFIPNDSPFSGKEGKFVTSRHLRERLFKETLNDVALKVEELTDGIGYKVSGRGELHLSILIEKMRREGYEFQVTRPEVILHRENGQTLEPFEELTIDVDEEYLGSIMENLGKRRAILQEMEHHPGLVRVIYHIPTRGLLGFKAEFMTESRGMGIMNYVFHQYAPFAGEIRNRKNGVLISMANCTTVAYALFNLQDRGKLFIKPQQVVYEGQIVGENARDNDLTVNPAKGKKLTNIRAAGSDENVILTPSVEMSLEKCISYINDDELVEITPKEIRLRKKLLKENERKRGKSFS
ncbi:MAG: translational GTPase TypA [Spirochaetes bacterium]|nr:translational GTPase TypA [Spirochaetota bacterium]